MTKKISIIMQGKIWVAYFVAEKMTIETPFCHSTPHGTVVEKIQALNPEYVVN